jgi:hypothetical protein
MAVICPIFKFAPGQYVNIRKTAVIDVDKLFLLGSTARISIAGIDIENNHIYLVIPYMGINMWFSEIELEEIEDQSNDTSLLAKV